MAWTRPPPCLDAKSRPYQERYVENAPGDAPRHSETISRFTLPSKQPSRRATPRAALLCSRPSTMAAVPSSPLTAAAVRMWWLPGVLGAIQPPIAAQVAHAATCDGRKSTISARCERTALRAFALPAERHRAERLATSCLTSAQRGTCFRIAIPRRANAAVPAPRAGAAWVAFRRSR